MNAIDIFRWDDNFNTGLPKVDEQHRRLVELLNVLASHVAFRSGTIELGRIFSDLTDYAQSGAWPNSWAAAPASTASRGPARASGFGSARRVARLSGARAVAAAETLLQSGAARPCAGR